MFPILKAALVLLTVLVTGCTQTPEEVPPTLDVVSEKITYDSVARMGAHHAMASITQTESRSGEVTHSSAETIEIAWNSWESFHFQRTLDGEVTFEAMVHQGRSASRSSRGAWVNEFDGEAARMDVYTAWNAWDEALGTFIDMVGFESIGPDTVDGRPVERFNVLLKPVEPTIDRRKKKRTVVTPISLEGTVSLDAETAVRLKADVHGVVKQGNVERETTLQIRRSQIGKVQLIELPPVQLGTAGDQLKKLPKRPSPQKR
jgi:hypothetical protein